MNKTYSLLNSMLQANQAGAVGTVISGHPELCLPGTKFVADHEGHDLLQEMDSELFLRFQEGIADVIKARTTKVIETVWHDATIRVFIDPIVPQAHLLILGGGHIALPLVSLGKLLGYQVTVIDDRLSFANPGRFPQADHVICEDFRRAIRNQMIDLSTYVIVVTRGHRHDRTCLEEIFAKPAAAYTGMIGSRRKIAALFEELRASGWEEDMLNNVYTPIGLDIGAQTPEEIAVSIIAEIIMVNRQRYSLGLKIKKEGKSGGQ